MITLNKKTSTELFESKQPALQGQEGGRIHYLDNLRAYAMLLGVVFHGSLAYSPLSHNVWLTADMQKSTLIDVVAWCTHLFRMPIFFLIAGYFAFFLLEKRGLKEMMKNRAKRILVPFVLFLPIIMISTFMIAGMAVKTVANQPPLLQAIGYIMSHPESAQGPVRTMHLWFLYILLYMYIVAILFYKKRWPEAINRWINRNVFLFLVLCQLFAGLSLITKAKPHPSPESLIPELWAFGFYGLFFLLGCYIYRNYGLIEQFARYRKTLLISGLLAYSGYYFLLPGPISLQEAMEATSNIEVTFHQVVCSLLEGIAAVNLTLGLLIVGKKYLNHKSRISRYIADSSYWVYLIHLPVLIYIQFMLIDKELNLWIKFFISCGATVFIGIGSYALLVRWTPIGALLNGKRKSIL